MEAIVLGCHASGTSLVSHLMIQLGVHMGNHFIGPVRGFPVYEDGDFVRMNARIMKDAGGNWSNPPLVRRVKATAGKPYFAKAIPQLIAKKTQKKVWGWKDPRTSITIPAYHEHLQSPHYVTVFRDRRAVAKSILKRGPSAKNLHQWMDVASKYNEAIRQFLEEVDSPVFEIHFEDITDRAKAKGIVRDLNDFLLLNGNVKSALSIIDYRKV